MQGPAKLLDLAIDDIEADTTPRYLGHLAGRGKPGLQHKLRHIAVRHVNTRVQQPSLDGLLANCHHVHTGTVIRNSQHNIRPVPVECDRDTA